MVNLDQIVKAEDKGDYYRIYFASGDVEEVETTSLLNAIQLDEGGVYKFKSEEVDFSEVSDDDVEDMTDLSDGNMVGEADLATPSQCNAQVEGSTAESPVSVDNALNTFDSLSTLDKVAFLKALL